MKIVTYNVNGLRPRIAQFGSLLKLLDSFDADIICIQETKLRRQELRADLVIADGYETFVSCTRTSEKGRTGYSGVATFCRVKSAFSSNEVALPVRAEEGFTGLLESSQDGKRTMGAVAEGLEEFSKEELLQLDSEGRCIVTDHGHFVLFNIYGPRAESDDSDRVLFKLKFYNVLQKRWEHLLHMGKRVFVVGDLNIAPTSMDRCDAGPDFENNEFRRWLRSLLVACGGRFIDVFRAKHPDRRDAYTCWPQSTGAEVFNYGTRIDHILCAGPCLHHDNSLPGHNIVACHVMECDILSRYKRWKDGNSFRWKGEQSVKLEGSDHAPVSASLLEIPDTPQHSTPSLSARYNPKIHGLQQTLVSMLLKRQAAEDSAPCKKSNSSSRGNIILGNCSQGFNGSFNNGDQPGVLPSESCSLTNLETEDSLLKTGECAGGSYAEEAACNTLISHESLHAKALPENETRKRVKRCSQMSLKSFFQKNSVVSNDANSSNADSPISKAETSESNPIEIPRSNTQSNSGRQLEAYQDQSQINASPVEKEKSGVALLEWRRIQQVMQNSIPLCKGHKETCVARVVKKQGPNNGRRFYVCARAEGPASNPEANCGYFKWAASKSRHK
ncbi:DNA-(apurinic or apyrimidinic site) lyase 2 isoform X1 [Cucumis melo var. makuwa]|uniref:DNA-(apurinic or apyrimidinic site) endonuclease n=2 Tax=Cucumis melo TaxID=3656 RepID=A0A5A7SJ45_CUCMM|nr:DNA-(apurinic or apyrimidinic site) lyase 2 isoform X1 [Cucumis melo var. makuwa]TYK12546.1 DNA-(apurinic or apyrimidinic site) lyase 2 isoform X1 [Cucumis melo var. makuwa]